MALARWLSSGIRRSRPDRGPGRAVIMLIAGLLTIGAVVAPGPATALDVFTLWRQPEIPLTIEPGMWVEYRTLVMAGGRHQEDLMRLVCVGVDCGEDGDGLLFELLPLTEDDQGLRTPAPGEGLRICISPVLLERDGRLIDAVRQVVHWREGVPRALTPEEWREDPLVAASFSNDFTAQEVETAGPTNRVIEERQLACEQFVFSAADTESVDLPAGRMVQITSREISVAVHDDVPFLGVVYAAERIRAESKLDTQSQRLAPPPPRARVEIMELLAFGRDGQSVLAGFD